MPEDNKERVATFKQQRATSKSNISRIKNQIDSYKDSVNVIELECRLEILNSYIKQIMAYQTEIEKIDPQDDKRAEIEELCVSTKTKIMSLLGQTKKNESSFGESTLNIPMCTNSRLPPLSLPSFGGKYSEYTEFIGSFKSLVHSDSSIPIIEKFNHLLTCLKDEALQTVKAFHISEQNYAKALNRLDERYNKKCLIFFEKIDNLFNLAKFDKPSATQLRSTIDIVAAIYDSLASLGTEKEILHGILIHIVMTTVDSSTKSEWSSKMDYTKLPTWEECTNMVIRRSESIAANTSGQQQTQVQDIKNEKKRRQKATFTCAPSNDKIKCHCCKSKDHYIQNCQEFTNLPITTRFEQVKKYGLCINCLRKGHSVSNCHSSRCRVCQRAHNTLLHKYDITNTLITDQTLSDNTPSTSQAASLYCSHHDDIVLLATAVVKVKDKFGIYQLARAILDSGSQVNFITEEMAQRLQLKRQRLPLQIVGIGAKPSNVKQKVSLEIKSRLNDYEFNADMCVINTITSHQPDSDIIAKYLQIPSNISLADPHFYKRQKIDLLIGAEIFYSLLSVGQIQLHNNLPTLQKTSLGWIVSGRIAYNKVSKVCNLAKSTHSIDIPDIDKTLKQFWEIEEIPTKQHLNTEHLKCNEHFLQTSKLLPIHRFELRLPFKQDPCVLGSSYAIASRRFFSLEKRLLRTPDIKLLYNAFMEEYLQLGHMEVMKKIPNTPHYFIPHQYVLRLQSTSTKLRVVFDASAKTSTQVSLNDILMVGPVVQPDLYTTLLKFRLYEYVITADITKMYRQILVNEADRKFQLIVWRATPNEPLKIYRLNTVTYGTASAPFLATNCLIQLSEKFKNTWALGAKAIKDSFYMDDLLCGSDTVEELNKIKQEIISIFEKAGFQLAKWASNYDVSQTVEKKLCQDEDQYARTLGISWCIQNDQFHFKLGNELENSKTTKRTILSQASRLFDPLGLVCPIIIKAKILLQELWLQKVDWDESVPMSIDTAWQSFKEDITAIQKLPIPRYVNTITNNPIEVHGFADASVRAYGSCIYIRTNINNNIVTHLLTAKSKVAPLKTKSLPRLELCAAHLLVKMWKTIAETLAPYKKTVTFWSDSEIVLFWLKNHPSKLSTFVANRVAEIQHCGEEVVWRHVPSKQNPADLASRGCTVKDLMNNTLWFHGPEFLKMEKTHWPKNTKFELSPESKSLEIKNKCTVLIEVKSDDDIVLKVVENSSTYMKILKIITYIYRFKNYKRNAVKSNSISSDEFQWAFLKVIATIQQREFTNEISLLRKGSTLPTYLQKLNPFIHELSMKNGTVELIRVGGRLLNAPIPYDAKFPLLLSKQSSFAFKYIQHLHWSNCHAGPKALLGILRQHIWMINAREITKKVVHNCIRCFRYKPKLVTQLMGNLPADRLQCLRPFFICGVDFCGPFQTSYRIRGRRPYKTYAAIFVCFSSKAIHIEVVSDLTADAFIAVLKRFFARRGLPKKIYCDNATNFVGANSKLKELRDCFLNSKTQSGFASYAAQHGVEFVFIPPRSPHFGGLWEAGVKSTKNLLYRTVGNAYLSYEELITMLNEIEAILNSRPISAMSNDPNDGEALTPAHLLIGATLNSLPPDNNQKDMNMSLSKRWQLISHLKNQFWTAFQKDYMLSQQCRTKWNISQNNIKVGDLVTIHEDNLPPQRWRLGRIVAVVPGSDGRVRVVDVKTSSGIYRRSVHKLALLPIS